MPISTSLAQRASLSARSAASAKSFPAALRVSWSSAQAKGRSISLPELTSRPPSLPVFIPVVRYPSWSYAVSPALQLDDPPCCWDPAPEASGADGCDSDDWRRADARRARRPGCAPAVISHRRRARRRQPVRRKRRWRWVVQGQGWLDPVHRVSSSPSLYSR